MTGAGWVVYGGVALAGLGTMAVLASSLGASARHRRAFERMRRVTQLERGVGFEVSYPEADLPTIRIVSNPNDRIGWRPWVALGFPGEPNGPGGWSTFDNGYIAADTSGLTARGCARKARRRLYGIYLARAERGRELIV